MKELYALAESSEFRRLLEDATKYPAVQGIVITVDKLWLYLVRIKDHLPKPTFERLEMFAYEWLRYYEFPWFNRRLQTSTVHSGALDWSWRPRWWKDYQMANGERFSETPILVRVYLLPWHPAEELPRIGEYKFRILFERREQARFCSTKTKRNPIVGGLSIGVGPNVSGTLGGVLEDQRGKRYGLTCAHVAVQGNDVDQPAQSDASAFRKVGVIAADSKLKKSASATPCNPANPRSVMNHIDAALVEFDSSNRADLKILTLGGLSRVLPKTDLNPGDGLYFVGKESGPQSRHVVVAGIGPTFRFKDDNENFYCFENTLQVEWPYSQEMPQGAPIQDGDSGSWLCLPDGTGYAWAAQVIGKHRDLGYAIFADQVMAWADGAVSDTPLKVI
jgi:hypothetical protein